MAGGSRRAADETLAVALACGRTVKEAAALAGVSESTAFARLREDAVFKDRVRELRACMVASALGRLSDGMASAADALTALVSHTDADTRFKAACKVIELAVRVREQTDLEERLAEVERRLSGGGGDDE